MIVESGNIANTPDQLDKVAVALSKLHYDAIGLGSMDLRLGDDFYSKVEKNKLTIVDSYPDRANKTKPYIIKSVDGVKVGIVSFGAPPFQQNDSDEYQIKKALYAAYKEARSKSDILIVLDQSYTITKEWLDRNGARLGYPDVVIGGAAKQGISDPEVIGKTQIYPTSIQGKNLGVVDVEITPGQDMKLSWKKVVLDDNVKDDPEMAAFVKDTVHPGPNTTNVTTNNPIPVPSASVKPYYPSAYCKTCHIKEYEDWAKTKHAVALKTLVDQDRTTPECMTCHSEQFRQSNKFVMPKDHLAGVECATCHADAIPHGMERRNVAERTKVSPELCVTCHNKDKSPDYDEKTYMPKIAHNIVKDTNNTASTSH